jgi:phage shock protein A
VGLENEREKTEGVGQYLDTLQTQIEELKAQLEQLQAKPYSKASVP